MNELNVTYEASFIEEGVFQIWQECKEVDCSDFYRGRDSVYEESDPEKREILFKKFYDDQFLKLGLNSFFNSIIDEFPLLVSASKIIFKRVWDQKAEGAELYVQGDAQTIQINIRVNRLNTLPLLKTFLRHELMHISDMLDPSFQYSPNPILNGRSELENNLVRERFRLLWDLYISHRIHNKGFDVLVPFEKQRALFKKAFFKWDNKMRERIFREIQNSKPYTQQDLLSLAEEESLIVSLGEGGLRCPLCEFTSYEPVQLSNEDDLIIEEIKQDQPDWKPVLGLCRQCFDMYQSKARLSL